MAKKISISQLKHIEKLEFEIPLPGVYLLSGQNGSGKSSLLACLMRVGHRNAFPRFFRTSQISDRLDQFDKTSIQYTMDGESVSYRYSGERWIPTPKKNSRLLKKFGYGEVLYIAADAKRIEPRPEDFRTNRIKDAPKELREAAESILGASKFRDLKTINVRKGVGSEAFILVEPGGAGKERYYSEKNFSLGEICILKLLRELRGCPNGSLVLIDELELALYPRTQVSLVRYLEDMAKAKGFTVIFSTHSPSLIRAVDRDRVLFLAKEGNAITCVRGCYPAYALGQISVREEITPDVVLYVEDMAAKSVVDEIVRSLNESEFSDFLRPTVVAVPVGGFREVVQFLGRAEGILPAATKQFALLDKDVETESVANLKAGNQYIILQEFEKVKKRLRYLPWTPEVGIVEMIAANCAHSEAVLRKVLQEPRIEIDSAQFVSALNLSGVAKRDKAKKLTRELASQIAALRVYDEQRASNEIAAWFVSEVMKGAGKAAIKELFLPLLKR
jgi:predicted ATPase